MNRRDFLTAGAATIAAAACGWILRPKLREPSAVVLPVGNPSPDLAAVMTYNGISIWCPEVSVFPQRMTDDGMVETTVKIKRGYVVGGEIVRSSEEVIMGLMQPDRPLALHGVAHVGQLLADSVNKLAIPKFVTVAQVSSKGLPDGITGLMVDYEVSMTDKESREQVCNFVGTRYTAVQHFPSLIPEIGDLT